MLVARAAATAARQQQTERGEARFIDSIAAVVETDATDVEEEGGRERDIAHWVIFVEDYEEETEQFYSLIQLLLYGMLC